MIRPLKGRGGRGALFKRIEEEKGLGGWAPTPRRGIPRVGITDSAITGNGRQAARGLRRRASARTRLSRPRPARPLPPPSFHGYRTEASWREAGTRPSSARAQHRAGLLAATIREPRGEYGGLRAALHAQLGEHRRDVVLGGLFREGHAVGDLAVGQSLADKPEHSLLLSGERSHRINAPLLV